VSNVKVSVTDRSGKVFSIEASPGTSLMQAMKDRGLPVAAICSGAKSCATCHVFVEEGLGRVGAPDEDECDLLSESSQYRAEASRLSCQIELGDDLQGIAVRLAPQEH
jgi:ferredoxin, 2Fe-2S